MDSIRDWILIGLYFVMMFGIGMILNLLMKATWLPVYLFLFVMVPVVVWATWQGGTETLGGHLLAMGAAHYAAGLAGLAGAGLSGWSVRKFRSGSRTEDTRSPNSARRKA